MKIKLTIIMLLIIPLAQAGDIVINEVEINPTGSDSGNEWIELYSEEEYNLNNYTLENGDGDTIELNGSYDEEYVIDLPGQWLDNGDEKVYLKYLNETVHETPFFSDTFNDNRTWQYCNGIFKFEEQTYGEENICEQSYFIRGDANMDERVDIADVITILMYDNEETELLCQDSADANDDGEVDFDDAVFILNFLFSGGDQMPTPYPQIGFDITKDDLRCEESLVIN